MYPRFGAPKTLTKDEQRRLLRAVRTRGSRRDLALVITALGTGLRLPELAGLNVGDAQPESTGIAWKVALDPETTKGQRGGTAYLVPLPLAPAHGHHERLPWNEGPLPDAAVRLALKPAHDHRLHPSTG